MIDVNYVVAGINVAKCEYCGFDRQGHVKNDGGNVFISVDLNLYERIRHTCAQRLEGRCRKCRRISKTDFVHPAAPKAKEQSIRELSQRFA